MSLAKRIAIYTSSFPPKTGGIAVAHFNLFRQFSKQHDVKVFVFRDRGKSEDNVVRGVPLPGMERAFTMGLRRLLRQPVSKKLENCDEIAKTAASVFRMNNQLRQFAPHLIICPDHYLPTLVLKKPNGAKLAWMARHNYLRFSEQPLCAPASYDDLQLAHRLETRAVQKADILVSPSQYMCDLFGKAFGTGRPTYVAKNFVMQEQLDKIAASPLRQSLGINLDVPIVCIPSGGSKFKGSRYTFEIVRRIAARLPVAFYISGHLHSVLRHELENHSGDAIVFAPGKVSYEDNLANVAACDLTVSPTVVENLSNALVESMMLGVPVVTFDTGGNKEIVHNGKTGYIVPYGDVDALIKQSIELLTDGEGLQSLREDCGMHAGKIVDQNQINSTYDEILSLCE